MEQKFNRVVEPVVTCVKIRHEDGARGGGGVKRVWREIAQSVKYYTETRSKTKEILKIRF